MVNTTVRLLVYDGTCFRLCSRLNALCNQVVNDATVS
jgi:hypothetical protein